MIAPLILLTLALAVEPGPPAGDDLRTVAEASGYRVSARHAEVVALCRRLAARSKGIHLGELGQTVEGRSIPLLILADPPVSSPEEAARSGKLVALLVGNIHAGEVCGKEALPMLARELIEPPHHPLLESMIVAMVPIYNADGNERVSKHNRPGQNGPEQGMGQRANARGLDLNRDFIKLEAPETRALVRFVTAWDPELIVDTHTTNGSRHRYLITYEGPKTPAGDPGVIAFVRGAMLPGAGRAFEAATGHKAFFYGNFERGHTRWTTYPALPRFGTSYFGLCNRIAILSEAYSYAPFEARVRATRDFVRACLEDAAAHRDQVRRVLARARAATVAAGREPKPDDRVAIRARARAFPAPATVLGYDGAEPKDYQVELVQDFEPTATVPRPYAYLVQARDSAAVAILQRHGIALGRLRADAELDVEVYRVDSLKRTAQVFEGHRTVDVAVTARRSARRVPAGTIVARTAQPLGALAVYLLEPHADDGLCTWNVFDAALEPGRDFPVLRLPAPAALETDPVPPLLDDR
jgi:hypothetical protein